MEKIVEQRRREERARTHAARLKRLADEQKRRAEEEEMAGQTIPHTKSRIFKGLKILGQVSNHVPCVLRYIHRRRENFIVTCIGKSVNTYASNQLSLLSVSGTLKSEISCMAGDTYHVYTASENVIYAWRRGVEITHKYTTGHDSTIEFILPFGEHLISIDETGRLCMRDIKSEELLSTIQLDPNTFRVSALMHPVTYINKILLASHQGSLQLWNVKKMRLVHLFSNWADSSILHVAQAPAIDCVALALSKKRIVIHNLRYNVTLMTLKCEDQPLTIGFRTDNVETMVTGNSNGSITLWDLNNQEVLQHMVSCHSEPITGLQCYHQEPLFFTSSPDNSLKLWIFDGPGGTFRELCTRVGHSKPPGRIRFFGSSGFEVLSAGKDGRLRQFHVYNETINRAWGENKIPLDVCRRRSEMRSPIADFSSPSIAEPMHHDDIAIITEDEAAVTTWCSHTFKQGNSVLFPLKKRIPNPNFVATCLYVSSCGQFVVIGYDNGAVHRYNIQSGQHRFDYGAPNKAHLGSVRGVVVDYVNTCVASAGADKVLKLWKFEASELFETFFYVGGISALFRHKTSSLLGVILDNFEISIVSLESFDVIREFKNAGSPIQDAVFSPDCRWLTAASADCLVRTWDLPTGNMIDIFRLETIVTHMDYSPKGQFLATALSDNVGILLWFNKTIYSYVSLMPVPLDFEPPIIDFDALEELPEMEEPSVKITGYDYESPEFLNNNLITFSGVPETRWKNLLHLDTIRERNKAKSNMKKQVAAPFFLPSVIKLGSGQDSTPSMTSETTQPGKEPGATNNSKIISLEFKLSAFAAGLMKEPKHENYHDELCKMLENMGASQVETEIIALGPEAGGSLDLLDAFISFLGDVLASKRHTDTIHAYTAYFMRAHIETLISNPRFATSQEFLHEALELSSVEFINLVNQVKGLISVIHSGWS